MVRDEVFCWKPGGNKNGNFWDPRCRHPQLSTMYIEMTGDDQKSPTVADLFCWRFGTQKNPTWPGGKFTITGSDEILEF